MLSVSQFKNGKWENFLNGLAIDSKYGYIVTNIREWIFPMRYIHIPYAYYTAWDSLIFVFMLWLGLMFKE